MVLGGDGEGGTAQRETDTHTHTRAFGPLGAFAMDVSKPSDCGVLSLGYFERGDGKTVCSLQWPSENQTNTGDC